VRRLLVLFNPHAHRGGEEGLQAQFDEKLRAAGFDVLWFRLDEPGDVDKSIAQYAGQYDGIVIGGGDGSIRSALPALLKAALPVGVWPLGTANDFARSIGIVGDDDCVAALGGWDPKLVDVADVNGIYFINNVTVGLPAEAAARLTRPLKARLGVFASIALIPTLWKQAKPFSVDIQVDGRRERRTIVAAMVGNGEYEGGFPIHYSGLADGKLHLAICNARTPWAMIPILFDVATSRIARSRRIESFSATSVSLQTSSPKRIAADGDIVSETPATVALRASALAVFTRPVSLS
jgi:diacylglycerol kinase (ATP)